ncbi:unnamed protein product [Sphenostylis stenocarpa]|uniref:Uncharacterized protein n=1 Tax=Sphenostylis stenocarpa TaxID=92480 RepID=A0AA86W0B0_9FABA|nr:unnamed protein product [Sphenostylis stenocarpa]
MHPHIYSTTLFQHLSDGSAAMEKLGHAPKSKGYSCEVMKHVAEAVGISWYMVQLKEGITLTAKEDIHNALESQKKLSELLMHDISAKGKKSDTKWREAGLEKADHIPPQRERREKESINVNNFMGNKDEIA